MKYILILVSILIVGGWFYWFQWRPSQARAECTKSSATKLRELASDKAISTISDGDKVYDLYYRLCMGQKGLE